MLQPVIGYTLDHETGGGYSKLPWYAIRENYLHSAIDQNALAIALSHKPEQASAYLDLMDGLVIIGGDFDIDPALYGDTSTHETVRLKETRTAFEWAITEQAIARGMPVLGICGGQQLLAVVLGGTLIQHIPEAINTDIAHEQPNPRHEVGHTVRLTAGSLLHQIIGQDEIGVNSAHHQAVAGVPDSVVVNATAPDGLIEGIELPATQHPFCVGVQWHPEYHVTEADTCLWRAFIEAARQYRLRR